MRFRKQLATFLLGACPCLPAWADIYAFAVEDGPILLSNEQLDERYTLLIHTPEPEVAPSPAPETPKTNSHQDRKAGYEEAVEKASRNHGLESALLHAVITVESRYDPKAVSHKGATGLMQLMPATAKRYGVADAFDPAQNLDGGAKYLKELLGRFGNNTSLALAAYNAGEGAVKKHGNRIPPYRETRNYVTRVLDFYKRYSAGR